MMSQVQHRMVETNGIRMHIAEQGSGPTVLLCHGFPECWYSWRHQLSALAAADFHAVAPDMRGYGPGRNPLGRPIDRSAGLIAPSRVVINAVGRVGDHKVRRDATEHARNVGRHCAVAAEQAMRAEPP